MSNLNVTRKTYYALGMVAAALTVLGGMLYLLIGYVGLLFNAASFLSGAMMLMLCAEDGLKNMRGKFCAAALVLMGMSLVGGTLAIFGGALAWPCFALPYWKESEEGANLHTISFLVILAGCVQLIGSFIPLPIQIKACLSVVIAASQLVFVYLLYCEERDRQA